MKKITVLFLIFYLSTEISFSQKVENPILLNSYSFRSTPKILNELDGKLFFYTGYSHHLDYIDLNTLEWEVINLDFNQDLIYDTLLRHLPKYNSLEYKPFPNDDFNKYSIDFEFIQIEGKELIFGFTIPIEFLGTIEGYPKNYDSWVFKVRFMGKYNVLSKEITLNAIVDEDPKINAVAYYGKSLYLINQNIYEGVTIIGEPKDNDNFYALKGHSIKNEKYTLDSVFFEQKWTEKSLFKKSVNPFDSTISLSTNPSFFKDSAEYYMYLNDTLYNYSPHNPVFQKSIIQYPIEEFIKGKKGNLWVSSKDSFKIKLTPGEGTQWTQSVWSEDCGYYFLKTKDNYTLNKYSLKP